MITGFTAGSLKCHTRSLNLLPVKSEAYFASHYSPLSGVFSDIKGSYNFIVESKADLKQHVCINLVMIHSNFIHNNKKNGVNQKASLKTVYFWAHST